MSPLYVERRGEIARLLNEVDALSERLHDDFPTITEEDYKLFGPELKIVIGTVPLFCKAGFIESFLTRHTEFPDAVKLTIILLSAAFIVYYYIVLPYLRNHHATESAKD